MWYENTLRAVLKQLNIEFKRTPLVSAKVPKKYAAAYGWEITTPLAELSTRPMICL